MGQPKDCPHDDVVCVNQHEFIRKYRCIDCGEVMMCSCDEDFGRRFLSHQLIEGCELETQARVPVTIGFQSNICRGCRGLPLEPAPAAAIPGRTSKVKRFYWRELFFWEKEAVADWDALHPDATDQEIRTAHARIEHEVLDAIKRQHATAPLYDTTEPSQADILDRCQVAVESFYPEYAASPEKGAVVLLDGKTVSVEAFVADHFEKAGWSVMELESRPLHALFGVMMWMVIQDPSDPLNRMVSFGSRTAFEARVSGEIIWTHLPEDFGTSGYGRRRKDAIEEHFDFFFRPDGEADAAHMLWLFDYWRFHSEDLRQYLWAHRDADIDRARRLIEILPAETILSILRYLVEDYWGRFVGWPDLLAWRVDDRLLIEVKSSSDRLSGDQMRWIVDNFEILHLPFLIAKLHRPSRQRKRSPDSDHS